MANFYSVAVNDKSCAIRLLAKFEFPTQASNKTRLKCYFDIFVHNFINISAILKIKRSSSRKKTTDILRIEETPIFIRDDI